jgi:uncharacterized Rmd1/YagE family protein
VGSRLLDVATWTMKQERRADTEKYASEMSDEEEYEIEDVRYSYDAASLMSIDGEVVRMTSAKTCKQRLSPA